MTNELNTLTVDERVKAIEGRLAVIEATMVDDRSLEDRFEQVVEETMNVARDEFPDMETIEERFESMFSGAFESAMEDYDLRVSEDIENVANDVDDKITGVEERLTELVNDECEKLASQIDTSLPKFLELSLIQRLRVVFLGRL
jgi:hypothetical protein